MENVCTLYVINACKTGSSQVRKNSFFYRKTEMNISLKNKLLLTKIEGILVNSFYKIWPGASSNGWCKFEISQHDSCNYWLSGESGL